jgi:hypothetical protein
MGCKATRRAAALSTSRRKPWALSCPLGSALIGITDTRAFVVKLSPEGAVVLSALIGGLSKAQASGIVSVFLITMTECGTRV